MAKKKAKKKSASKKSRKMEPLIVGSKVKAAIKAQGCNSSADVQDAMNAYLYWLIEQATARAKANGRKTVRAHDVLLI